MKLKTPQRRRSDQSRQLDFGPGGESPTPLLEPRANSPGDPGWSAPDNGQRAPEAPEVYVRVGLPVPLGRAFTYRSTDATLLPGFRVAVELGRQKCIGVVLEVATQAPADIPPEKLKPVLQVLDSTPALPAELLSFLLELARYYLAPIGEVLRLALPALERSTARQLEAALGKKWKAAGRIVQVARALPETEWPTPTPALPRGRAQELLAHLTLQGTLEVRELTRDFSTARSLLKRLEALGVVQVQELASELDAFFTEPTARDEPKTLNPGQQKAVDRLIAAMAAAQKSSFLLQGVTASGKTEVYLQASAEALRRGLSVIVLVPEIALTPQLVGRFRARLGDTVAAFHSGLTEPQRLGMWQRIRAGELRVVVGARSALFAPVTDLGLICVDEEHDPSFKQEEGVRYNARDMALLRAHKGRAICVLGSATPSLESHAAVRRGQLEKLELLERACGGASLPTVEVVDLRSAGPGPSGDSLLSLQLHRAIEANLRAKGQTILFLNRRGFAPSLLCSACGAILECPHCAVALTVHRRGRPRVECHYCDYQSPIPERCAACEGAQLLEEGLGTEKVEDLLVASFPGARVARLDRDVAAGLKSEKILSAMRRGEIDILVGTQMVTKGHDLPEVTLVGVLNADAALSLPDFRASERTFHLLVQVAGRAGRADRPGRVLIQTRNPEHPAVVATLDHDVERFVKHELRVRHELSYPPFARLALIRIDGSDEAETERAGRRLAQVARQATEQLETLGPAPAPLAKLRNRYRYQLLLRAATRPPLHRALLAVARAEVSRQVRVVIDVDPRGML